MDAALQATMESELASFGDGMIDLIGVVLPIALGIALSITGLVVALRWFRRLAGF